jgi:kynurenine formamidase
MDRRHLLKLTSLAVAGSATLPAAVSAKAKRAAGLWGVWDQAFARARFVNRCRMCWSLTARCGKAFRRPPVSPRAPAAWMRPRPTRRSPIEKTGLETTAYTFATDQFGTQLDPPAHWHPCFAAIDELPPTLALRKLAVISIAEQVKTDVNHQLTVADVRAWERRHGRVPAGAVVMVRSDWHKRWPDAKRFQPADGKFPGVSLQALKFLHLERQILLHGHEPLDTDSTPTLASEDWLMANGYMQAEGVAHLEQVPETGALVAIGFPRLKGGTGGFASFTAICPPEWSHGIRPGEVPEAPLPFKDKRLVWNEASGRARAYSRLRQTQGQAELQLIHTGVDQDHGASAETAHDDDRVSALPGVIRAPGVAKTIRRREP